MHKQTVLRISLPQGIRMYPSQFRNELAKQPGLANSTFHRDEVGQTINARPRLRMAGAMGWVGLVANPGVEDVLTPAMGPAIMAVSSFTRSNCSVNVEKHDFGISSRNEPQEYWIREMVLKRNSPKSREQDVETLIKDRTLTSIEATCGDFDMDCPTAEQLGIRVIEIVAQRGMYLETTVGVTKHAVTLVDARVLIHADLKGFWFVGNLTSRGYGRLIKPHPNIELGRQRRDQVLR